MNMMAYSHFFVSNETMLRFFGSIEILGESDYRGLVLMGRWVISLGFIAPVSVQSC